MRKKFPSVTGVRESFCPSAQTSPALSPRNFEIYREAARGTRDAIHRATRAFAHTLKTKPHTTMRIVRYTYPNFRRPALSPGFSQAPWSDFSHQIDRLFETALGDFAGSETPSSRFPVDVFEDKERTYVRAELPGVNREDINVEIADGSLLVSATRKTASAEGQAAESVSFQRSLELPEDVQADQIAATYENGILTVTLPKREEAKPRKIAINVK